MCVRRVEGERVHGELVVPTQLADPLSCFEVDVSTGEVLVGTAMGAVLLGRFRSAEEHVGLLESDSEKESKESLQLIQGITNLCASSEEIIKAMGMDSKRIVAVVGDLHIKVWERSSFSTPRIIKLKRPHHYSFCTQVQILTHEKHAILGVGSFVEPTLLYIDLQTLNQYLPIPPKDCPVPMEGIPTFFDGNFLSWVSKHKEIKLCLWKVPLTMEDGARFELADTWEFPSSKVTYWGFQFSQPNRKFLVMCSKRYKLSVWNADSKTKVLSRKVFKRSDVACFLVESKLNSLVVFVVSRFGEFSMQRWDLDSKMFRALYSAPSVSGSWYLGFTYKIRRFDPSIFYSSDMGLHVLQLDSNLIQSCWD